MSLCMQECCCVGKCRLRGTLASAHKSSMIVNSSRFRCLSVVQRGIFVRHTHSYKRALPTSDASQVWSLQQWEFCTYTHSRVSTTHTRNFKCIRSIRTACNLCKYVVFSSSIVCFASLLRPAALTAFSQKSSTCVIRLNWRDILSFLMTL